MCKTIKLIVLFLLVILSLVNTTQALFELGVRENTVSNAEIEFLDDNGYLILQDVLSPGSITRMTLRLDELTRLEGDKAGIEVHQEEGANRLSDLINKDSIFDVCFTHSRVLASIAHILQDDLKLSSLNYRAAQPGSGLQRLHADWSEAVPPWNFQVCNSIWLLDDFTADNGPTRVVPGSHNSGKLPTEVMDDYMAPHSNEIYLIAPAGTVVVFNSHTWHGGTLNRSLKLRRALHSYFCRRRHHQQLHQAKFVTPETLMRLSPAARFILDV